MINMPLRFVFTTHPGMTPPRSRDSGTQTWRRKSDAGLGDRDSEVKYLAESVGITEVFAGRSPEEKVAIVKEETAKADTLFVGDGINDAPALMAATVGVVFGTQNDITTEAADASSSNQLSERSMN